MLEITSQPSPWNSVFPFNVQLSWYDLTYKSYNCGIKYVNLSCGSCPIKSPQFDLSFLFYFANRSYFSKILMLLVLLSSSWRAVSWQLNLNTDWTEEQTRHRWWVETEEPRCWLARGVTRLEALTSLNAQQVWRERMNRRYGELVRTKFLKVLRAARAEPRCPWRHSSAAEQCGLKKTCSHHGRGVLQGNSTLPRIVYRAGDVVHRQDWMADGQARGQRFWNMDHSRVSLSIHTENQER